MIRLGVVIAVPVVGGGGGVAGGTHFGKDRIRHISPGKGILLGLRCKTGRL